MERVWAYTFEVTELLPLHKQIDIAVVYKGYKRFTNPFLMVYSPIAGRSFAKEGDFKVKYI